MKRRWNKRVRWGSHEEKETIALIIPTANANLTLLSDLFDNTHNKINVIYLELSFFSCFQNLSSVCVIGV